MLVSVPFKLQINSGINCFSTFIESLYSEVIFTLLLFPSFIANGGSDGHCFSIFLNASFGTYENT